MPKFMIKATYTAEGLKGLRKDKASGREKAIAAACEAMAEFLTEIRGELQLPLELSKTVSAVSMTREGA